MAMNIENDQEKKVQTPEEEKQSNAKEHLDKIVNEKDSTEKEKLIENLNNELKKSTEFKKQLDELANSDTNTQEQLENILLIYNKLGIEKPKALEEKKENTQQKKEENEEEKTENTELEKEEDKEKATTTDTNIEKQPEDVYKEIQTLAQGLLWEKQFNRIINKKEWDKDEKNEILTDDKDISLKKTKKLLSKMEKAVNNIPDKTEEDREKQQNLKDKIAELKSQLPATKKELLKEKQDIATRDLFENPKYEKFFNQMFDSHDQLSTKQQEQRKQKIADYLNIGQKESLTIKGDLKYITKGKETNQQLTDVEKRRLNTYPEGIKIIEVTDSKNIPHFITFGGLEQQQEKKAQTIDWSKEPDFDITKLESFFPYGWPAALKLYLEKKANSITPDNIDAAIESIDKIPTTPEQKDLYRSKIMEHLKKVDTGKEDPQKQFTEQIVSLWLEKKLLTHERNQGKKKVDIFSFFWENMKKFMNTLKWVLGEKGMKELFDGKRWKDYVDSLEGKWANKQQKLLVAGMSEYNITDTETKKEVSIGKDKKIDFSYKNLQENLEEQPDSLSLLHPDLFKDALNAYSKEKGKNNNRIRKNPNGKIDLDRTKQLLFANNKFLVENMGLDDNEIKKHTETKKAILQEAVNIVEKKETDVQQLYKNAQSTEGLQNYTIESPAHLAQWTTLYATVGYNQNSADVLLYIPNSWLYMKQAETKTEEKKPEQATQQKKEQENTKTEETKETEEVPKDEKTTEEKPTA